MAPYCCSSWNRRGSGARTKEEERSGREEVWNLAGVGTRCFDVLTSSHIQQPNTVFDCQPRLDAGALPGDDTGNAHAIHDPSDDAWHPRDDDELANGKLAADVTNRFRAIRRRRAGRDNRRKKKNLRLTAGKDLCIDLVRVGIFCCPSTCLVRGLAKPTSRVFEFESSSARGVTDRVLRAVIFQNPYCVLGGLKMAEWWVRVYASWAWAGVFLCSRNLTVSQKMHERSVDAQISQSRNLAIGRWCCRGENTAFAL